MLPPQIGLERRKDPQKVRSALVDSATKMIAEQGLARVTVDAVARAAGVTKGGLFHHFPTKQALIDGVLDAVFVEADATIDSLMADDPEPHGRFTRALLNGVFADHRIGDAISSRTLCLAMLADPDLQRRWANWIATKVEHHAATDNNVRCEIVRLATDGIWLTSLHDVDTPPPVTDQVRAALIALTRPDP